MSVSAASEQVIGEAFALKDAAAPVPRPARATLGQQLIGADLITPQQLDQALAEGSQKGLRPEMRFTRTMTMEMHATSG